MVNAGAKPPAADYHLRAWPLIYGTILTTGLRRRLRPDLRAAGRDLHRRVRAAALRAIIVPVVRLLAAVPSVIYGLIGILVLVPFVGNHLISTQRQGVGRFTSSSSPARACSSRS